MDTKPTLAAICLLCLPLATHAVSPLRLLAAMEMRQDAAAGGNRMAEAPALWERRVGRSLENLGVARVERLGTRWVLTIECGGAHTTYLDDATIDLSRYAGSYVRARYHYADRTMDDPKCFRAPCAPVHERRIVLERLRILQATPAQARETARRCGIASPVK